MKKVAPIPFFLLLLSLLSAFSLSPPQDDTRIKYGVYKTYEDYVHGKITELGEVQDCSQFNKYYGFEIVFANETVKPATTKYWGCKVPEFKLKSQFKVCYTPQEGTYQMCRYSNGEIYHIVTKPLPIGIYSKVIDNVVRFNKEEAGDLRFMFDKDDNVTNLSYTNAAYAWASKGNGDLIEVTDKRSCRSMFEDDPELQNQYDMDKVKFKGHSNQKTEDIAIFAKYVRKYNRKHMQ